MQQTLSYPYQSARLLLVLLLLVLAGCSAARPQFAAESARVSGGDTADEAMPYAEEFAAEAEAVAQADSPGAPAIARKVIANASITLVVAETSRAVESINGLMNEVGGYVSEANLYRSSYGADQVLRGSLTLRVPAERLEEALEQLEALALEVESKSIQRQDVTDQYSDVDAQLRNLEAAENELRELLAEVRAKPNATPDDIIAVLNRLTDIRGQIEQLQGRKNMLDNLIALSTINLTLVPDVINRPIVDEGWRPGVVLREALRTLVNALQGLGSAAIWFVVVVLPLLLLALIPLILVGLVLRALVRLLQRRSARRKAATPDTPAGQ